MGPFGPRGRKVGGCGRPLTGHILYLRQQTE